MASRSQSFGGGPPQQQQQQQHQHHQQQQPQQPRSSPFAASGPVATVNHMRTASPGQYPGIAVRTTPTQLSTPLVAPRRSASSHPTDSAMARTGSTDSLLFPTSAPMTPTDSSFQHAPRTQAFHSSPAHSQGGYARQQAPGSGGGGGIPLARAGSAQSPFRSPSPSPQQQQQYPPRTESYPPSDLFGGQSSSPSPAAPTPLYAQNQRPSGNLFGSPQASPRGSSTSPAIPPPPRSTQSFSYGQTSPYVSPRAHPTEGAAPPRTFGQPPPPAAPFLGYGDPSRGQSLRAPSPSPSQSSAPSPTPPDYRNALSPSLTPAPQRASSGQSLQTAPPPRIHVPTRSADDLLDEFMRAPMENAFLLTDQSTSATTTTSSAPTPTPTFPRWQSGQAAAPVPKKLTLADIPNTVAALEQLYCQKRWKTLTKKSLSMLQDPSNQPQRTLSIKSWWLAGLIKDGHYDNATSVLDQIGNLSELDDSSFVTMRLRLLEAMLRRYKGQMGSHEKKMFALIAQAKAQATASTEGKAATAWPKWLRIAQFTLANHLVHENKFSLALRVCAAIDMDKLHAPERVVVLSRLGRLYLQMGDLGHAESLFTLARKHMESVDSVAKQQLEGRLLLNDGLLLFAQNKLQEALSAFDSILHLEAAGSITSTASLDNTDQTATASEADEQLFLEEDLVCVAVNNYAICALYCCDVRGAVTALERMIRSDPSRFLNAVVVFNLSSLYDLIFDNVTSTTRKEMMKKLAELYDLEHIDPAAFRI